MGLNAQPSSERVHIGFFGLRNAGKSSVVNRVTGQTLSIVSDVKGTTTDPVQKAMELLPIGPVVIIDTPGIDDEGTLGACPSGTARAGKDGYCGSCHGQHAWFAACRAGTARIVPQAGDSVYNCT